MCDGPMADGLKRPLLANHDATTVQGLRELTLGSAKLVLSCDNLLQPLRDDLVVLCPIGNKR